MSKSMYLVRIQYLGYRLHGWQRQPQVKTVQELIEKTLRFVMGTEDFKILTASRTDAMVSVESGGFELFTKHPIHDLDEFLADLNYNLPADIRALKIQPVDQSFNIINGPKTKEYNYLFVTGEKIHPFCAPFMTNIRENVDIDLMKQGAKLYEGTHNFKYFCYKPKPETNLIRTIEQSYIDDTYDLTANFFPDQFYVFKVFGKGFMRYQIRLMMGALIELGAGKITLSQLEESLVSPDNMPTQRVAPASGLILKRLIFDDIED